MACRSRSRRRRKKRNFFALDATCPLVTKVHREAEIHHKRGREIVLIGHAGHPEVVGTIGQLPAGAITLMRVRRGGRDASCRAMPANLAYVTQTTLSVDDTADIVAALKARFPQIHGPHKEDICYATTNRQEVVKKVAPMVDAMIVVGSPNSSNTQRLKEVAERAGCPRAALVKRASEIDWSVFGSDREPRHHRRRLGAGGSGRGGHRRLRRALRRERRDRHHRRRETCSSRCRGC